MLNNLFILKIISEYDQILLIADKILLFIVNDDVALLTKGLMFSASCILKLINKRSLQVCIMTYKMQKPIAYQFTARLHKMARLRVTKTNCIQCWYMYPIFRYQLEENH